VPNVVKTHLLITAAVVAAHVVLAVLWPAYLRLLVECGAMFSYANDIADAPRLGLIGAVIVGLVWIAVANGFVRWWRLSGFHER
jgi:hypothetical protein